MISKEDLRDLINRIKIATGLSQQEISVGASYAKTSLAELLSSKKNLDHAYNQLMLVYGARLKKTMSNTESRGKSPEMADRFTAEQLFAMFLEVSKVQTEILGDIKRGMARGDTQATMHTNLVRTLTGVEVLNQDSQKLLKMVKELTSVSKAHRDPLSPDDDKKEHQIGGDGKKPGKHRG